MTYFIGDGFDTYGAAGEMITNPSGGGGNWDSGNTGNVSFSPTTRFCTGRSFSTSSAALDHLIKTGSTNENTWFCAVGYIMLSALGAATKRLGFQFRDGTNVQCSVVFQQDGSIAIYSGTAGAGTLQATYTSAFVANSFDHFQFKFVIHNTAGEVHIRKNGAASDSFSATSINTRGGSSNNYANAFCLHTESNNNHDRFDDLLVYNGNTASAPYDWVGDVRAIILAPNGDTAQKQFSTTNAASLQSGNTSNANTEPTSANFILTQAPWTANAGGTFTTATVEFNAGFTGNAKLALYLADGLKPDFTSESLPGTLIAVSNQVTNPGSGANSFTFASAVPIMKGWGYAFALITDAAYTPKAQNGSGGRGIARTYASGFPNSLSNALFTETANSSFTAYATVTLTNFGCLSDRADDGASTYVSDSTVGDYDLYTINSLPYTPNSIVGVTLRSSVAKSDALGKTLKIKGLSAATSFETAAYSPLTTFSNFNNFYSQDPATSAAWTPTGLNNLQIGPKVEA